MIRFKGIWKVNFAVMILFVCTLFIWTNSYALPKEVKFAVITDPHIGLAVEGVKDGHKLTKSSVDIVRKAVETLNKVPNLSFVLVAGDITYDAEPWNVELIRLILDDLNMPYYVTLGNHDLSPTNMPKPFPAPPPERGMNRFEFAWVFQGKGYKGPNLDYVVEPVPGLMVMSADTNLTYDWNGHLSKTQLKWIERQLGGNPDKLFMVLGHQNYIATHDDEVKGLRSWNKMLIDNAEEAMKIYEKYPQVSFVFTGHRHTGTKYKERNGIYYFNNAPATSWPMRYTVYTLKDGKELSWESIDIPVSQELHELAKENLLKSAWWRISDATLKGPDGKPKLTKDGKTMLAPDGKAKMLKYYGAEETRKGTVPVRFKP